MTSEDRNGVLLLGLGWAAAAVAKPPPSAPLLSPPAGLVLVRALSLRSRPSSAGCALWRFLLFKSSKSCSSRSCQFGRFCLKPCQEKQVSSRHWGQLTKDTRRQLTRPQFCSRAEKKSISKKNKCLENFFRN